MDQNKKSQIMSYCGNCGKELVVNATFCAFCGTPIPKIGDYIPPQDDTLHIVTKSIETSPRRSFFTNFRGAIVAPKEEMPKIAASPNFSQPFFVNIIIGFLTVIGLMIFFDKYEIIFDEAFFTFLPTDGIDIEEYKELYKALLPISSPISTLLNWLILSFILWLLHTIFASDLRSNQRNYKTMATIVGWAQLPMIINQIITIIYNAFFITSGGVVIFRSLGDMEITSPVGGTDIPLDMILLGVEIMLVAWSLYLIYYAIRSLGSFKANPVTICVVYGILSLLIPI